LAGLTTAGTDVITVTVNDAASLAQLKTINESTAGAITLNVSSTALSGSASDMAAAFAGISDGYQGNLSVTGVQSGSAGVTTINTVAGATTGKAIASLQAKITELSSLSSGSLDEITVTITDASATAVEATALSSIGSKTVSSVTVSNAVAVSGTLAEATAAFVTAGTAVVGSNAVVTLDDPSDTSISASALNALVAGVASVKVSSGIVLTGSQSDVTATLTDSDITFPSSDYDVSITGLFGIDASLVNMYNAVAKSTSGELAITGTGFGDNLNASTYTGNSSKGLTINGLGQNDTIVATSFNDTVDGGTGNDTITGGTGNDTITGGTGADTFTFEATSNGLDTIKDYDDSQNDILDLDAIITGGQYDSGTAVVDGSTGAISLANVNNKFVHLQVADISSATINEESLFGADLEFAAEGTTADVEFILAVGEGSGTDGVKLYQVNDGSGSNDMSITQIGLIENNSLADILTANLDVS
jgi:Ca2+-binding RTX toxin-like protein